MLQSKFYFKELRKLLLLLLISICVVIVACSIGSVFIHPFECINIVFNKMFNISPFDSVPIDDIHSTILLKVRIPRTFLAFICGASLSVSGAIMQSILRNPLASSYTLGVSSGAALGASVVIFWNLSFLGVFTLPTFGLIGGVLTILLALAVASKLDKTMNNNSIILMGMAFSLFANAMLTLLSGISKDKFQQLIFWQMGSLAMKGETYFIVIIPVVMICFIITMGFARHLDIITLGDEQAKVSGVNIKIMKWFLTSIGAIMTGVIVSVAGVIGFLDMFTPHAARKIFGANHKQLIPASFLMGGSFLVICDLIARTILAPVELPVGAITGVFGAPFFIYLYFGGKKND